MSKRIIFLLFVSSPIFIFSQTYEDVIILKNGSEIHGVIIEQKPDDYIKIQSGKNIFVYEMNEIELMKKELISEKTKTDISKNHHSIGIGLGTNKAPSLIQYTYDLKLSNNISLHGLTGFTNFIGLGLSYQDNYNENGLLVAASLGFRIDFGPWDIEEPFEYPFLSSTLAYQWRLFDTNNFISAGLSFYWYSHYYQHYNWRYDELYWGTTDDMLLLPVLSIEKRF